MRIQRKDAHIPTLHRQTHTANEGQVSVPTNQASAMQQTQGYIQACKWKKIADLPPNHAWLTFI